MCFSLPFLVLMNLSFALSQTGQTASSIHLTDKSVPDLVSSPAFAYASANYRL